jgi:esterase/lipase superfamily enzyme
MRLLAAALSLAMLLAGCASQPEVHVKHVHAAKPERKHAQKVYGHHHYDWRHRRIVQISAPLPKIKGIQTVQFVTNRKISPSSSSSPPSPSDVRQIDEASITDDRSSVPTYGTALVSIPATHTIGNVERPGKFLWIWSRPENAARYFTIQKLNEGSREALLDALRKNGDSILIFVHGYNVSFKDAIFKAAQIAFDSNFGGEVIAFSWPSAANVLQYDYDRESANYSAPALAALLADVSEAAPQKKIFLVAHSLGNQITADALQQLALEGKKLGISELVMAAPDIDADVFTSKAEQIKAVAGKITVYASSADKALLASNKKSWGSRLGYIEASGPHLIDGIEVIDVTAVGNDMFALDHGTFSSSRAVLDDLARLIASGIHPPLLRTPTLRSMPDSAHPKYWMYPP